MSIFFIFIIASIARAYPGEFSSFHSSSALSQATCHETPYLSLSHPQICALGSPPTVSTVAIDVRDLRVLENPRVVFGCLFGLSVEPQAGRNSCRCHMLSWLRIGRPQRGKKRVIPSASEGPRPEVSHAKAEVPRWLLGMTNAISRARRRATPTTPTAQRPTVELQLEPAVLRPGGTVPRPRRSREQPCARQTTRTHAPIQLDVVTTGGLVPEHQRDAKRHRTSRDHRHRGDQRLFPGSLRHRIRTQLRSANLTFVDHRRPLPGQPPTIFVIASRSFISTVPDDGHAFGARLTPLMSRPLAIVASESFVPDLSSATQATTAISRR